MGGGITYSEVTFWKKRNSMENCHTLCRQRPQRPDPFGSHGDLRRIQETHCRGEEMGGGGEEEWEEEVEKEEGVANWRMRQKRNKWEIQVILLVFIAHSRVHSNSRIHPPLHHCLT